jgi:hypothetical protein
MDNGYIIVKVKSWKLSYTQLSLSQLYLFVLL